MFESLYGEFKYWVGRVWHRARRCQTTIDGWVVQQGRRIAAMIRDRWRANLEYN